MKPCKGTPTWEKALDFFFCEYLPCHRGGSRNTQESYATALRLLLGRVGRKRGPHELSVVDVLGFLEWLEQARGNRPGTRNARLAALNSFWKALRLWDPAHRERYESLGEVPTKRCVQRSPDYLETEELRKLYAGVDPQTRRGFRDGTILRYMYNTGSRISEVVDAQVGWLSLGANPEVKICGKGGKSRVCPLWETTAGMLRAYLQAERGQARPGFEEALFLSQRRRCFTRSGLWKLLHGHLERAALACPSMSGKRLSPHSLRHTTAVNLLRAGVEVTVIKAWLGHADVGTTSRYLDLGMDKKREALELFLKLDVEKLRGGEGERPVVLPASVLKLLEEM